MAGYSLGRGLKVMTNKISNMRKTRAMPSVRRTTAGNERDVPDNSTNDSTPTPTSRRMRIRITMDLLIDP